MSDELDDVTLARARRGDRAAQAALIDRYAPRVYALLGRLLVNRPDLVDDLAQDAMLKVLRALPAFDPAGPARLSTWILTVASRTGLDALRRCGRELPLAEELPAARGAADEQLEQRRLAWRVARAIGALPAEQRAVLLLRGYHELEYAEIAAVLGVELGTVKSRLGRARAALRAALGRPAQEERR